MDWREFCRNDMSMVDQIMREDPRDVMSKMDFSTRDVYQPRHRENRQKKSIVRK